jgi:DNA mismatch repair ATPase MutS
MEAAPMTEPELKCICIYEEGRQIAWACFDESNNEILMDDLLSNDSEGLIYGFMNILKPNLILIGAKTASNSALLDFLTCCNHEDILHTDDNVNENEKHGTPYKILKSSAFDLKQCKALILTKLRILSLFRTQKLMENHTQLFDNGISTTYHSVASIIDFDSSVLVRAVGALLNYLQSSIFRMEEGSTITINNIRYLPSKSFMRIDQTTMSALHIFHTEHHPIMAKGQSHTKEGYSLFTLLDRTKSPMGGQCLKDIMLRPLLDIHEIKKRQDIIQFFVDSEHVASCASMIEDLLSRVGAVDKIILRMQKCHSNAADLIRLFKTLEAAVQICSIIENDLKLIIVQDCSLESVTDRSQSTSESEWVHRLLGQCHTMILYDLLKRITSIVDMEATVLKKDAVVIQFGFHEALDSAKEAFDRLDGKIMLPYISDPLELPLNSCCIQRHYPQLA